MVSIKLHESFLLLLEVTRITIGIGFIGAAIEIVAIVHALGKSLLFPRTLTIFAICIGTCGLSRLVDGYLLPTMIESPSYPHEILIWIFDSASASAALALMIMLFPMMLNARGHHWKGFQL